MTFDDLFERCAAVGRSLESKSVGFDFGELGAFSVGAAGAGLTRELGKPDCTFWMSAEDCHRLHQGQLDADLAFIDGRINATGDLAAALAYVGMFPLLET